MPAPNPYAPPAQIPDTATDPSNACYRDGDLLVVRDGAVLPPFCPFTGQPAEPSWKQSTMRISSLPGWVRPVALGTVFLCVFFLTYLKSHLPKLPPNTTVFVSLAAFIFIRSLRRRGRIQCFMTPSIRRSRLLLIVPGAVLAFAGVVSYYSRINFAQDPDSSWIRLGLILGGFLLIRAAKRLTSTRYHAGWFHLKGCAPAFLNTLPAAKGTSQA